MLVWYGTLDSYNIKKALQYIVTKTCFFKHLWHWFFLENINYIRLFYNFLNLSFISVVLILMRKHKLYLCVLSYLETEIIRGIEILHDRRQGQILHNQYCGRWCPCITGTQAINSNGIDLNPLNSPVTVQEGLIYSAWKWIWTQNDMETHQDILEQGHHFVKESSPPWRHEGNDCITIHQNKD